MMPMTIFAPLQKVTAGVEEAANFANCFSLLYSYNPHAYHDDDYDDDYDDVEDDEDDDDYHHYCHNPPKGEDDDGNHI